MKKNDTFILKIEDMGIGGEGIGRGRSQVAGIQPFV